MRDAIAAMHARVSDHGLRGLDRWFTRELRSTWPLDVGLSLSALLAVVTGAVVPWFHVIFVLVTVAALMLPFRGFVTRFALGVSTSVVLVLWAVIFRDLPSEELTELPLMSLILIIVYIGAQARARAVADLERTQQVLLNKNELELEGLRHQLQQAQRLEMLGRASTTMAHDLRNVFVVVRGAASEMDPPLGDDDIATRAKEILDATDRGMAIIGDLMTMGRRHDESGHPIDVVSAIRQYEQLLRRLTPRNVALRISSRNEPILIRIDRTSLLQILMNLIVNAAEAVVGNGEIVITTQQVVRHQPGGSAPPRLRPAHRARRRRGHQPRLDRRCLRIGLQHEDRRPQRTRTCHRPSDRRALQRFDRARNLDPCRHIDPDLPAALPGPQAQTSTPSPWHRAQSSRGR